MIINGVNNRSRVTTARPRTSNSIKQDSFGNMLKKSSAKDTFSTSAVSNASVRGGSLGVADTQAKLDKISAAIKDTDYSGMSKTEIYADIEKRYDDAFDDFYFSISGAACIDHIMVREQFYSELRNQEIDINMNFYKEAKGYTDMSYDEIETAIKEKYLGKTSFSDQLNLFGELFKSGVLSNKYGPHEAVAMIMDLDTSLECGGNKTISKSEWLSKIEQTGASSPFSLLLNNPYFSLAEKELFKSMVDDILFGVTDKK